MWRTRAPGPPILFLHPINGLSPELLHFALELESWGYRVYLPSLYGDPVLGDPAYGYDRALASMLVVRRSGTWRPHATGSTGTVVGDAAALARWVSQTEGGVRVAVIGNSFTGAFPLALLAEPTVSLAVLGQPSLPAKRLGRILLRLPDPPRRERAVTLSEAEWSATLDALRRHPEKRIVGFHYREDPVAPIERFDALHERLRQEGLADRFHAHVLGPPGDTYEAERAFWVRGGSTGEVPGMLTPHSTYLDAAEATDRAWFRDRLRRELAGGW
jgi:dienelactone hydrolase